MVEGVLVIKLTPKRKDAAWHVARAHEAETARAWHVENGYPLRAFPFLAELRKRVMIAFPYLVELGNKGMRLQHKRGSDYPYPYRWTWTWDPNFRHHSNCDPAVPFAQPLQ